MVQVIVCRWEKGRLKQREKYLCLGRRACAKSTNGNKDSGKSAVERKLVSTVTEGGWVRLTLG